MDDETRQQFQALSALVESVKDSLEREIDGVRQTLKDGFAHVNQRLDRIDATLTNHARQIAAGTRSIAGFTEWAGKADADYIRLLAEVEGLKTRVEKLESR